jgi:hypothetical protein
VGNGATVETEAPASRRKPPATATPSTYGNRARRRLYPFLRVRLDRQTQGGDEVVVGADLEGAVSGRWRPRRADLVVEDLLGESLGLVTAHSNLGRSGLSSAQAHSSSKFNASLGPYQTDRGNLMVYAAAPPLLPIRLPDC